MSKKTKLTKPFEILPYRLIINILQEFHLYNIGSVFVLTNPEYIIYDGRCSLTPVYNINGDLSKYHKGLYGYFKLDRTRKLFMLFKLYFIKNSSKSRSISF